MTITIYHNPACGTSRNVLALLRHAGETPEVIDYLRTPPGRDVLADLIARMGGGARALLRRKGTPYDQLGLDRPDWTEDQLADHMLAHPILINRPIVVTPMGVKLCRPSDVVLDLLPAPPAGQVLKEEGVPFLADAPVAAGDQGLLAALAAAGLPTADLAEGQSRFFAYRSLAGLLLGFGGYDRFGPEALIRSVVVVLEARGRHIGRTLVPLLRRRAWEAGAVRAWLLTPSAGGFFGKIGFKPVARDQAPSAILTTRQARELCPSNAGLLARTISF